MRTVRIYKDDIRVHILRSLFFTDTVLALSGALIIAGLLFAILQYGFHYFNWNIYLASVIVGEITFLAAVTHKVDNQPVYKIAPRGITFKTGKKQLRQKDLEPYFVDFSVQDNLIVRNNALVRIYEVEPFDIALLNEQDREHFFIKLKQMIHILPSQVEFIVRKEQAKNEDYSQHFFSLYDQSNTQRESLIERYIQDLSNLVTKHSFMSTHHYAVFSVPCETKKPYEKVKAVKKLNDMGTRFASALFACNIGIRPLPTDELISFAQTTLR